jgi:LmbE family N-acetylglucosaminyl deacetylase
MVLAAHPDDETIGASGIIGRAAECRVVYLTDGAPRDRRLWPGLPIARRADYARIRRKEMRAALALAGVPALNLMSLGGIDQETVHQLPRLSAHFVAVLRQWKPEVVITHPYEGGHPDHDTAALVARTAIDWLQEEAGELPQLLEMTSYHHRTGACIKGEFLPCSRAGGSAAAGQETMIELRPDERDRKRRMFDCYASQTEVLRYFALGPERLRRAPKYDFSQPPHPGKLWYEVLGWPITGARWREVAAAALSQQKAYRPTRAACA